MTPAIGIAHLTKTFGARRALDDVSLDIRPGEMVALIGASGSGKSTLLRHIAGLAVADRGSGEIRVHGRLVQRAGRLAADIREVRAGIGFVFQQFNLVGRLPLIVNVMTGTLHRTPLWRTLPRLFRREDVRLGYEALARVGIAEFAAQRASTLSGGQQQRAAIARALVQGARVVLADEPIASLDPESARRVMEILAAINREDGCTVLVSLHQVHVALRYCARVVALAAGRVVYDGPSAALDGETLRRLYGAEADEILGLPDWIPLPERREQAAGARDARRAALAA
ncbi:MAG: phosphonate ABC transporter ATP-binding protein [Burkholderiales bacterium]|nr:phosphonate ABC transporter ATP-binding protein [Burkholderiales bacterium]